MYGFIFGFHRLARCPKCTPASIRSLTASATKRHPFPRENSGPRSRDREPRATVLGGIHSVKNEILSYRRDAPPSNPNAGHSRADRVFKWSGFAPGGRKPGPPDSLSMSELRPIQVLGVA